MPAGGILISELSLDLARRHVFSCTVTKAANILGTLRNYDEDAVNEKYEFVFMRLIPIIINSFHFPTDAAHSFFRN